ncbi:MAG TPA: DUF1223 domain-containing protein [Kofleriaceae bacterium]|nr:DUF1223 domain-containing protein [Kofleriaceae bacterium]
MRFLACVAVAGACTTAAPLSSSSGPGEAPSGPAGEGAIVVELFTSQGCSSCPPADRLLTAIAAAEVGAGTARRPVIALAFHVDYWNNLGWRDPFSSSSATARQETYVQALGRGLYTPQLVVNGRAHVVGSRRGDVERAIANATPVPALAATAALEDGIVRVRATPPAGTHAMVAVFENELATEVRAGENRGEQLRNDRVVRALEPVGAGGAQVSIDPSWRRDHLGVVVLAQRDDGSIAAAREVSLSP